MEGNPKTHITLSQVMKYVSTIVTVKLQDLTSETFDTCCTINTKWYVNNCLPKILATFRSQHPKSKSEHLLLHHENEPAHTTAKTLDSLMKEKVQVLPHPTYSPYLTPCDFFLFPMTKKKVLGWQFLSDEEDIAVYNSVLTSQKRLRL